MGDNSGRDKNTVEAAGQSVGIKDQEDLHSFSDFVEQEKKKIGRGGKDNFSYKALQELGRQWLASRGVKHNEC